jgi:membrane protein implicated in regulation of membrane protease activity
MIWNWVLMILGALMVLIEVSLGGFAGFDLVLVGSAFIIGGGIGLVFGQALMGYIVAAGLCVAYIAVGRRWLRHRLHTRDTVSNADALIGQRALVTERVGRHDAGQVKISGEVWRAIPAAGAGDTFDAGTEVTVTAVNGVTVEVQ